MPRPHVSLSAFAVAATLASTALAQNYDTAPVPPEWVAPDAPPPAGAAPAPAPQPVAQPAPAQQAGSSGAPGQAAPTSAPADAAAPLTRGPTPVAPGSEPSKPPPRRMQPYSKPMMIGGGVSAGLGAYFLLFGGFGGFDDGENDSARTAASVVIGSVLVLGGTPLLIIGAQSVPVEEGQARRPATPSPTPRVRISATSADATWTF